MSGVVGVRSSPLVVWEHRKISTCTYLGSARMRVARRPQDSEDMQEILQEGERLLRAGIIGDIYIFVL